MLANGLKGHIKSALFWSLVWTLSAVVFVSLQRGYIRWAALWSLPGGIVFVLPMVVYIIGYRQRDATFGQMMVPVSICALGGVFVTGWAHPILEYQGWVMAGSESLRAPFGPRTPSGLVDHWAWLRTNGSKPYDFATVYGWRPNFVAWMWAQPLRTAVYTWLVGYSGWVWSRILAPGTAEDDGATVVLFAGRLVAHVKLTLIGLAHAAAIMAIDQALYLQARHTEIPGLAVTAEGVIVCVILAVQWRRIERRVRLEREGKVRAAKLAQARETRAEMGDSELVMNHDSGRAKAGDGLSLRSERDFLGSVLDEEEVLDILSDPSALRRRVTPVPRRPTLEISVDPT